MSDIDFSDLNAPNYSGDGVDRSRWKFDENGFAKATDSALLLARQQLREQIKTIHQDIEDMLHPNDYDVTLGGVPIDKATLRRR